MRQLDQFHRPIGRLRCVLCLAAVALSTSSTAAERAQDLSARQAAPPSFVPVAPLADASAPEVMSSHRIDAWMAALKDAGAAEVAAPSKTQRASGDFLSRLEAALALGRAKVEGMWEAAPLGHQLEPALALLAEAETYSEAKLLAQVALRGRDEGPPPDAVHAEDGDWVYEGRNVELPRLLARALATRREARDRALDRLGAAQLTRYMAAVEKGFRSQRTELAAVTGQVFDPRDDLYVEVLEDGQVWRRKKPAGYVASPVEGGEPGGGPDLFHEEIFPEEHTPGATRAGGPSLLRKADGILGGDSRQLRSRHNGFSMGGRAWMPKGALIAYNSNPDRRPIDVRCTGVKITERLVATAGHCLFKNGSWNANRRWVPGADSVAVATGKASDPSPWGYKNAYRRIVRNQWHDHEWRNYDFGLFVLYDNSHSCRLRWHGWWRKSGLYNDRVYLYGYPDDPLKCEASPLSDKRCYGSIYGASGKIIYVDAFRVHYKIDAQDGQSGTGFYVYDGGRRYVVGVHRGRYNRYRNDGVYINRGVRNLINDAKAEYPPNAC